MTFFVVTKGLSLSWMGNNGGWGISAHVLILRHMPVEVVFRTTVLHGFMFLSFVFFYKGATKEREGEGEGGRQKERER